MRGDVVVVRGDHASTLQLRLRISGALLLAVSAGIHLDLYLTGYRKIPTVGWLFLLQVIVGFMLTIAALVTRSRLAAAASAALALSTLGAYLLAVWIGLFGFKEIRTRAGIAAGLIEVAAFATLALAAVTADPARHAAGSGPRTRAQSAVSLVVGSVSAVSVAALALLGVAEANAGAQPAVAGGAVTLRTAAVGGVAVVTNAKGLTLYWFAPDTPATSKCTGSCTEYWPPVTGDPKAGPGVTGQLGTIKRPDGGRQATYDGHPVYTYIGDSPGQANGNKLDLNGGLWYEVHVSG
jgi:predicted lipoprotein with Yx(FWY)xxD motif